MVSDCVEDWHYYFGPDILRQCWKFIDEHLNYKKLTEKLKPFYMIMFWIDSKIYIYVILEFKNKLLNF